MYVYYGFSKLTKKSVRKAELVIIFENTQGFLYNWRYTKKEYIEKQTHIVYIRKQTEEEKMQGLQQNRQFTKYRYFIDDKPYNGDIDKVLLQNFEADKNNVSEKERIIIKEKLREQFFKIFGRNEKNRQLSFNF